MRLPRERGSIKCRRPREPPPVARDNSRRRCHWEARVPPRQVSLLELEVRSTTNSRSLIPGRRSRPAPIRGRESNLRALRVQVLRRKARRWAPGARPSLQIDPRVQSRARRPPLPFRREGCRPGQVPGPACNRLNPAAAVGAFLLLPQDRPTAAAARVQVATLVVSAETNQWAIFLRKPVNPLQTGDTSPHTPFTGIVRPPPAKHAD